MVMGGDSCSKGRVFEPHHHILDGHFSHLFVLKIVMFEKTNIIEKESGMAHFLKKYNLTWLKFSTRFPPPPQKLIPAIARNTVRDSIDLL